jgi:hypothetical protein
VSPFLKKQMPWIYQNVFPVFCQRTNCHRYVTRPVLFDT